jgi:adenosine deaminase
MSEQETTNDWLRQIPKAELHCHLDGSLRPKTIWELAQKQGVVLPANSEEEVQRICEAQKSNLSEYLALFEYTIAVMQNHESIKRITIELMEDMAAENGTFIEMRFAPLLFTRKGLTPNQVVEAALEGVETGRASTGVEGALILCSLRHDDPATGIGVAKLAAEYKNSGVVAYDLAGPERNYPPNLFAEAFEFARNNDVNLTIHAGEEPCPENIGDSLLLGADRIGHGLYLRDASEEVIQEVIDRQIPLEMCPTSNVQTSQMTDHSEHPFVDYFRKGVNITINTDNRLMSNTTMTEELHHIVEAFDLSRDDVRKILRNSYEAAFIADSNKKKELLEHFDAAFE